MRVLYFSPRICWPLVSGAHLRDYYFARQLARSAQLTYIGLTNDDDRDAATQLRHRLEPQNGTQVIAIRRDAAYRPANVLRGLLGPVPLNVLNFTSPAVLAQLDQILQQQTFDTIQIESMHLIAYARHIRQAQPRARLILDWHNIESEILARYADNDANPLRALYARRTAALSRTVEAELLQLCHAHTVCSQREREVLHQRAPQARIEVVGNGVDCDFFAASPAPAGPRRDVVFLGKMDYHANIDAALYFVDKIWPQVRTRRPDLRLVIVGAQPPKQILALRDQGITVTGTVPDVRPYYQGALASVVPLRVGGGTRLKILEAMAAGTPVISTRLGAEGLEAVDGRDILIADTPEAMADRLVSLQADTPQWHDLVANARRVVQAKYDWSVVGDILMRLHTEQVEVGAACQPAN